MQTSPFRCTPPFWPQQSFSHAVRMTTSFTQGSLLATKKSLILLGFHPIVNNLLVVFLYTEVLQEIIFLLLFKNKPSKMNLLALRIVSIYETGF